MNSKTHRENILNTHYSNIGIAVVEGTLNGEKTTLVVQEFGSPVDVAVAQVPGGANIEGVHSRVEESGPSAQSSPQALAQASLAPASAIPQVRSETLVASERQSLSDLAADPYFTFKTAGLGLLFILFILIALDLYIIRRRAIYRITSRHLPHLALISTAASVLMNINPGQIL